MDSKATEAYKRLKTVPSGFGPLPRSGEILEKLFEDHCKSQIESFSLRKPANDAVRKALLAIPGVAEAFATRPTVEYRERAKLRQPGVRGQIIAPKEPIVRLGSLHWVDVPPFLTLTQQKQVGGNSAAPTADPTGLAGVATDVNPGRSGYAFCWSLIGAACVVPSEGMLRFQASPSNDWFYFGDSNIGASAGGQLAIGQAVQMFQLDGTYFSTPVNYLNRVASYADYFGVNTQEGDSSGQDLSCTFYCPTSVFLECWVSMASYAWADDGGTALSAMSATVPSMTFDFWG